MNNKGKYALITGASSGIGYELAKLFSRDGMNLVLVSRNKDKLAEAATKIVKISNVEVKIIPMDLTRPEAPSDLFLELKKQGIGVEVLVNNAGIGVCGKFSETDLQKELMMIQLAVTSFTSITKLFLKSMLENKSGKILNVASGMALVPVPLLAVYSASKAYMLSFSEALSNELLGTGVTVTCLCPPQTDTPFFDSANMGDTKLARGKKFKAEFVARIGYDALMKGKTIALPGMMNGMLPLLVRIAPRSYITKFMRSIIK